MTKSKKIFKKNLQQLEKEFPGEILPQEKLPLLARENDFSKIALEEFGVEHLCFMILRGLGWKFLIPAAIGILRENPFAEGENIGYSLLGSVLGVKPAFWQKNPDLYKKVEEILRKAESIKTGEAIETLTIMLPQNIYDFRKNKPLLYE